MERSRSNDSEGSARPGAAGIGAARSLSAGRVLMPRGVAGSAGLATLAALILHLLARSIAGRSRLSFDRAPILHPLAGCAILRALGQAGRARSNHESCRGGNQRAVFRIVCSPWNCAGSSGEKQTTFGQVLRSRGRVVDDLPRSRRREPRYSTTSSSSDLSKASAGVLPGAALPRLGRFSGGSLGERRNDIA